MKNHFFLFILFSNLLSCTNKNTTEVTLISEDVKWIGFENVVLEKELFFCGNDTHSEISLTKMLSSSDSIYKTSKNRYLYSSKPENSGAFQIEGVIIIKGEKVIFSKEIIILPKIQPVGFNTQNAKKIKLGVENIIEISTGFPKQFSNISTNNGSIIYRNKEFIIIPETTGTCIINIQIELPSKEKITLENLRFEVIE